MRTLGFYLLWMPLMILSWFASFAIAAKASSTGVYAAPPEVVPWLWWCSVACLLVFVLSLWKVMNGPKSFRS